MRWQRIKSPRRWDRWLALGLTVIGQVEVWRTRQVVAASSARHVLFALATAVATGSLIYRRRNPCTVVLVASTATAAGAMVIPHADSLSGLLAGLLAIYTAASSSTGRSLAALVVAIALASTIGEDSADLWFVSVFFAAAWLAGRAAHDYRSLAIRLAEANERLELEAPRREELAAAEERTRIAREVHDILAHSVSVMVVQAEAAEEIMERDGPKARTAMVAVQDTGREALSEMRRLLGVLRTEAGGQGLDPQPGLDRLPRLVSELHTAGLEADLTIDGKPRHLPPAIELCAYRIVQEALTNVLKHSSSSRAAVGLTFGQAGLVVVVTDDGVPRKGNGGDGHGLVGIRERVAMYGGTARIGVREAGGFEVVCSIPYQGTAR